MVQTPDEFLDLVPEMVRAKIYECIVDGVEDYMNPDYYSDRARVVHTPRTRSSIRNDHIVSRLQHAALEEDGIRAVCRRGRILFFVGENRAFVAIKKFDRNLRPRSNRTKQSRDLMNQRLPFDLPEVATALIAGYRFKDKGLDLDYEVFIVCPNGDGRYWQLQLFGDEFPSFLAANQDALKSNEEVKRRIVFKNEGAQDEGNTTGSNG